jgi:very-short-patch-repair endonuclease
VSITGSRDQRVTAIAERQRARVARWQLLAVGVTRSMIHTMLSSSLLSRRRPGVYAMGGAGTAELTRETEALLAFRAPAFLSGYAVMAVAGLGPALRATDPIDIIVVASHTPRLPGIQAHRTSALDAKDIRIHRGLPMVSLARAFVEIAATTTEFRLARMLDDALHREILRVRQVNEALARAGRNHKGAGKLGAVLADRQQSKGRSRSDPELALQRHLRAAGLPDPDLNANFGQYQPDMVWWDQKVIVEVDSWRWHGSRSSFEADRKRDATLIAEGWTILHFTARQIEDEPFRVVATIATALARHAPPPGPHLDAPH